MNITSEEIPISSVVVSCSALIVARDIMSPLVNILPLALIIPLAVMFPCAPNTFIEPETSNISDGSFVPKPNLVGFSI